MEILWAILLVAVSLFLWVLNILGLPGNWMVLAIAVLFALLMPADSRVDLGWPLILALLLLAVIGEVLEFAAAAFTASREGGSKRGALLAILGSLIGGLLGMMGGGVIVPIAGSVFGALLGASLGALGGAFAGEVWKGSDLERSIRIGRAAFWGRLIGTVAKILAGAMMIMLIILGVVTHTL